MYLRFLSSLLDNIFLSKEIWEYIKTFYQYYEH